jgi:F-type H+-transporting ATPase subunit delta
VKNLAIARRYAKALLMIGKEDGHAESYREELTRISALISTEKSLDQAITNPLYDAAGRKKVLEKVIGKLGLSKVIRSFLILIFEKGRFGLINDIAEFYQKLADELKGIARASVVSATVISAEAEKKIRATLSKMTGKHVILDIKEDPSLIGGVITRVGDMVLDGSIRTQLINMRESLKRGEGV